MAGTPRRWVGPLLTGVVVLVIAWLTLRPAPKEAEAAARSAFLCLYPCGGEGLRDAILNVVMFVPLGLALRLWLPRGVTALLCVLATLGIETTQWLFLVGRDASLRDLLTNTLGGLLGILLAERGVALLHPPARRATRLAGGAMAAWLLVVALGAVGVRPSMPHTVYWGQHVAELGQFEVYRGELLESFVAGVPFPNGRVGDSERLRAVLLSDSLVLRATVVSGPAPDGPAPIVSIFDENQQQILALLQDGPGLSYSERTGLAEAELAGQTVHLPAFPGSRPGDTVHIAAGHRRGELFLRATSGHVTQEHRWARSPAWLVTTLNPFVRRITPASWVGEAFFLGVLLLPAGYWVAWASRRGGAVLVLCLPVALGLGIATRLAGIPPGAPSLWAGSLLGGLAGWIVARAWGGAPGPTVD